MERKLFDQLIGPLLVAAIGGLVVLYADVQVLKSENVTIKAEIEQLRKDQRYYHGDPIK